jgi:hypothetical protein
MFVPLLSPSHVYNIRTLNPHENSKAKVTVSKEAERTSGVQTICRAKEGAEEEEGRNGIYSAGGRRKTGEEGGSGSKQEEAASSGGGVRARVFPSLLSAVEY